MQHWRDASDNLKKDPEILALIDDGCLLMEEIIKSVFDVCVYILQVIGGSPGEFGFGYYVCITTINLY